MRLKTMCVIVVLLAMCFIFNEIEAKKKVIIHVPYHVKNIKHTHTIYKVVKHHPHQKHSHGKYRMDEGPTQTFDDFGGGGFNPSSFGNLGGGAY